MCMDTNIKGDEFAIVFGSIHNTCVLRDYSNPISYKSLPQACRNTVCKFADVCPYAQLK